MPIGTLVLGPLPVVGFDVRRRLGAFDSYAPSRITTTRTVPLPVVDTTSRISTRDLVAKQLPPPPERLPDVAPSVYVPTTDLIAKQLPPPPERLPDVAPSVYVPPPPPPPERFPDVVASPPPPPAYEEPSPVVLIREPEPERPAEVAAAPSRTPVTDAFNARTYSSPTHSITPGSEVRAPIARDLVSARPVYGVAPSPAPAPAAYAPSPYAEPSSFPLPATSWAEESGDSPDRSFAVGSPASSPSSSSKVTYGLLAAGVALSIAIAFAAGRKKKKRR